MPALIDAVSALDTSCVHHNSAPSPPFLLTTQLAERELGWRAELSLERMCEDSWRWAQQNPNGYLAAAPAGPAEIQLEE